ncbi:hypothetical protein Tco_0436161 [Tanacetum coccineum]
MSKYSTSHSLAFAFSSTSDSSSRESSFFLIISINITSLSSLFVQTNFMSDDWGTKPSDLKNELSWRIFPVTNETDGSGGKEGLDAIMQFCSHSQWKELSKETSDGVGSKRHHIVPFGELNGVPTALVARPHYSKDCPLKEEGKTLEEAYYTQFGLPFLSAGRYRAAPLGFYQRDNRNPSYQEIRKMIEESLSKFMAESAKRHDENSSLIKEIQASTDAVIRNQGASIKALKIQISQMSKNMDAYRDKDMGDVIFGKPFCRDACVEERWFDGFITIHNGNDIVTYQMARSHPRFKNLSNEQCNKIQPLLQVSVRDILEGNSHSYNNLKGFFKGVLNLGPEYIKNEKMVEWLTCGHVSMHEMD